LIEILPLTNGSYILQHILLQVPDENVAQLAKTLQQIAQQHPLSEIGEQILLEPYTSQNFMGFFVTEKAAEMLKLLAMQFVKEVSDTGNTLLLHGQLE
jgi:hypothetical protein